WRPSAHGLHGLHFGYAHPIICYDLDVALASRGSALGGALMIFGIHSLLFRETFVEKDLPLLDRIAGMGFDAVEIIPFDPDHFPAAKVKSVAADLGIINKTGDGLTALFNI